MILITDGGELVNDLGGGGVPHPIQLPASKLAEFHSDGWLTNDWDPGVLVLVVGE